MASSTVLLCSSVHSLKESPFHHYVALRGQKQRGVTEYRPKAYLVCPNIGEIRAEALRDQNVISVESTAEEFFTALHNKIVCDPDHVFVSADNSVPPVGSPRIRRLKSRSSGTSTPFSRRTSRRRHGSYRTASISVPSRRGGTLRKAGTEGGWPLTRSSTSWTVMGTSSTACSFGPAAPEDHDPERVAYELVREGFDRVLRQGREEDRAGRSAGVAKRPQYEDQPGHRIHRRRHPARRGPPARRPPNSSRPTAFP